MFAKMGFLSLIADKDFYTMEIREHLVKKWNKRP